MNRPIIPPSREGQAEAQRRAEAIADGLFAHQVEGVAFLLGRRRAILADDMGLGKTRQSIVALTEAAPAGPYLVICPASIKRNWQREIMAVLPSSAVAIVGPGPVPAPGWSGWVIVNYDILNRTTAALLEHNWAGLVFDEAHYLKNHTSQRSRLGLRLAEAAGSGVIVHLLTGTPLTNRPRDLFPLLQLARHPMARSFLSFAKRYCAAEHNGYGWVTDGASNLDELRVQLHGLMLRRTKNDVLDLPPKVRTWLPVEVPEGTARRESRRVLEMLLKREGEREGEDGRARGARIMLLGELARGRRKLAIAKTRHTIDLVQSAVDQGEKVLVFSCFAEPLELITRHFGAAALMLTGETPAQQRPDIVDTFQSADNVRVLAANIIAGGIGLNLTAARQVVFNDLDWVPANHLQAEDRAYRIGQTGTVNVTYMVGSGTIDEFVASVLESKATLVDAVVEGGEFPADVLTSLETLITSFSPRLAEDSEPGEDAVDRLLREVSRGFEQKSISAAQARTRSGLAGDAIAKLAEVLAGSPTARYRVPSSRKADQFYTLEVDGPDVVCDCPGFEYRGNCTHARTLKAALNAGETPPETYRPL